MRRVYMYVGQHQRLTGEVKKLPRALGVVRRREAAGEEGDGDELEIVEIVRHKIVFSSRPEPVGTAGGVVMGA
jgi:chromosome transmission fidelity protein 8